VTGLCASCATLADGVALPQFLEISAIAIGAMTYGEPGRGHPVWSLSEEDSRPLIKHECMAAPCVDLIGQ
jgi:hypothetical protein